ncbi:MAG TPA: RuvX/YqgF family protein [Candidatus Paceibacterota bacterium]|jgi:putative Holliday junction resolvase|nr:RuvX/YqgF family protein [Candidatus Paceibacterota bacterium]
MRVLGIDYGAKRVGIAISDEAGSFAFPVETVATKDALARIRSLIDERGIAEIAMGDTRSYGSVANPVTGEAEAFADTLMRETGLPLALVFEAGSSIESTRYTEGKGHDDASAAAIILQRHLDAKQ